MEVRRPLLHPDEYFDDHAPSWAGALGVVFASGTVLASTTFVYGILVGFALSDAGASIPGGRLNATALTASFAVLVGTLVLWVVAGALLHVVAMLGNQGQADDAEESFGVAAWGFPPTATAGLLVFVVAAGTLLSSPTASSPEQVVSQLRMPLRRGSAVTLGTNVAAACWQTYVWGFGLSERHEVSRRGAVAGSLAVSSLFVVATVV